MSTLQIREDFKFEPKVEVCSSLGSLKVQTKFENFFTPFLENQLNTNKVSNLLHYEKIIIDVMHGRYENISDEWWRIEADSVGTNGNNKATEEQCCSVMNWKMGKRENLYKLMDNILIKGSSAMCKRELERFFDIFSFFWV
ncbi:hypothetical protein T02_9207 [Trichinella nativa]|uniref:Uncharacterized protein n=1 Tax=Trichinella nativa TaxID=6335 RepID=A0A0V1LHB3_9BILA|nr:hypothetical protein T02_9207 [Trichinella nativa]